MSSIFFFFYCYAHHRDLHSFPTRRSSDLEAAVGAAVDAEPLLVDEILVLEPAGERLEVAQVAPAPVAVDELLVGLDRKSTRLNSSHGYISYAVFCLKKKKKKTSTKKCRQQ